MCFMNEKIKEYLAWKASYALRASVAYKIWLERFVTICGEKDLNDYSVMDIVKYRNWIESRYSSYNLQFAVIIIKNFFRYYRLKNCTCLSPDLIRLPRISAKSHRAVTPVEFEKIISVIPTNEFLHLRDSVMIRLLWDTGVRVSELCDLEISAIDESKTTTVIATKKTGKKRIIVWSDQTHQLLIKYLGIRQQLHNTNRATSALFLGYKKGRGWSMRITSRSVQRRLQEYVRIVGINEKVTPHSFRHGWAHVRRDKNASLAFIQRGLGHNNPASTFVYEQYNDPDFVKNARQLLAA